MGDGIQDGLETATASLPINISDGHGAGHIQDFLCHLGLHPQAVSVGRTQEDGSCEILVRVPIEEKPQAEEGLIAFQEASAQEAALLQSLQAHAAEAVLRLLSKPAESRNDAEALALSLYYLLAREERINWTVVEEYGIDPPTRG